MTSQNYAFYVVFILHSHLIIRSVFSYLAFRNMYMDLFMEIYRYMRGSVLVYPRWLWYSGKVSEARSENLSINRWTPKGSRHCLPQYLKCNNSKKHLSNCLKSLHAGAVSIEDLCRVNGTRMVKSDHVISFVEFMISSINYIYIAEFVSLMTMFTD